MTANENKRASSKRVIIADLPEISKSAAAK
jgi:hypothetical protein